MSGERMDRSENGFPRKRVFFDKLYYAFTILHRLNEEDWDTLMSHYGSNMASTFNFTWTMDGQEYLVEYDGPPSEDPDAGGWREVEVHLRTV